MDIKNLSRYKNTIVSSVIVIIILVLAQLMFSYYYLQESNVDAKIKELVTGEQTIAKWHTLKAKAEELDAIFLTKDTLSFKKLVEEKANAFGIKITSLNATNEEKDIYWEITMQLGMKCSYRKFVDFIKSIEEKSIVAENIRIDKDRDSKGETVDLKLKGYVTK